MNVRPDVVCRRLGENAVLVDLSTNQIFELNATGHRIWELVVEGLEPPAIVDRLQQEYAIDRGGLAGDVDGLLALLRSEGLIDEGDADAGSG